MTQTAAVGTTVSTRNKVGLVLAALLGLGDLLSLASISTDSDEPGPPGAVLIAGAVFGLITLVGVVYTWRTGNRVGSRVVAGSRILSMLGTLPAFFVPDVPAGLVLVAATMVVLTLVSVVLVLARNRA